MIDDNTYINNNNMYCLNCVLFGYEDQIIQTTAGVQTEMKTLRFIKVAFKSKHDRELKNKYCNSKISHLMQYKYSLFFND